MRGVPSGGEPSAPSAVEGPTVGAWEGRVWMEGDRQRRPSAIGGDESQKRITKVNGSNSLGFQWLPPPCKQVAPCRRWSLKFGGRGGGSSNALLNPRGRALVRSAWQWAPWGRCRVLPVCRLEALVPRYSHLHQALGGDPAARGRLVPAGVSAVELLCLC